MYSYKNNNTLHQVVNPVQRCAYKTTEALTNIVSQSQAVNTSLFWYL